MPWTSKRAKLIASQHKLVTDCMFSCIIHKRECIDDFMNDSSNLILIKRFLFGGRLVGTYLERKKGGIGLSIFLNSTLVMILNFYVSNKVVYNFTINIYINTFFVASILKLGRRLSNWYKNNSQTDTSLVRPSIKIGQFLIFSAFPVKMSA